ncbi:uncharacterized protein [Euwallacea similis]|uniref:uncharacterized protein isoform X2 n=1 Tax=Euwallacea similis TaxID=1736056 RepID=UPI00344F507D
MRLMRASWLLLLALSVRAQDNGWTWNQEASDTHQESPTADLQTSASETNLQQNTTDVEKVVDEILVSQRQGRALQGYDEVYSDPNVQEALQKGDDGEARNIIKDRLCYLGLMQCEEEIEGKRPYIGPEELIYAQPVAINPVGRPIPTIPVKGVRGGYGPAKPIPSIPPGKFIPPPSQHPGKYPSFAHNKPPKRGYGPSFGPNTLSNKPPYFAGGPINKPPPSFGLAGGEILAEGEFLDKPPSIDYLNNYNKPSVDAPYQFESVGPAVHHNGKDKRVEITVNAQGGLASATAASASKVEHVHHHFHHNADGVAHQSTPVVAAAAVSTLEQGLSTNGFIPVGAGSLPLTSVSGLNTASYGGQTVANYQTFSNKPASENFGPQTFGSNFGSASPTGLGSFGSSSPSFTSTNNNNFGGYYGSNNGLYKKELNVDAINGNYLGSNYADKYQGVESARAESYDCVCVPYDQCPTHEVIGRKDDLFLAIDPRNLKSDIQAEGEGKEETRVITDGNGTMTVVRVPKDAARLQNSTSEEEEEVKEKRKISKRDAPTEEKEVTEDGGDHTIQGRQYQSQYDNIMKKLKPTIGISFGLPYQGGGGYPFSPHGIYPHHGTVDATGVNLGLVSVNPLLSVQFTKDDYGNKVIKPFVNLHFTPNSYLVHKFEDLISYKKGVVFNKHKHYHVHHPHPHGYEGPYREHPGEFLPHHHGGEIIHPQHHHPEIFHNHPPAEYPHHPEIYHNSYPPHENFSPHYAPSGSEVDFHPDQSPIGGYFDDPLNYGGGYHDHGASFSGRSQSNLSYTTGSNLLDQYQQGVGYGLDSNSINNDHQNSRGGKSLGFTGERGGKIAFPSSRRKRDVTKRQAYYQPGRPQTCGPRHVCCKRSPRPQPSIPAVNRNTCGTRHSQGINGRIKNPVYVDGDSEFGEYPWQVAILKKDPKESVYVCGGTLIDPLHIITAAHCVKQYTNYDLRVRLGEWDVNHDVEFYPYIERDIAALTVHPEFYAGTLANDIAILRMNTPVDWTKHPHISPACLPHPQDDYTGARCWTTGWGKDAFGDFGKYQNILKEVDVPIVNFGQCQRQLQNTRLGYEFKLHPGFICAGGEEGKDACKGDGGGPMVCERGGTWQLVGVVSWGIGCGQVGVPGVYVRVAHYLDWIRQVTQRY